MGKSLYSITQEYNDIASQLEEGEFTPELETALAITSEELQNKAVSYGFVIKQFDDEIDNVSNEIKRLQDIKKAKENAKDRIKQTISDAMLHYGITEVKIPTLKLNFRESKSVEIVDADKLARKYLFYQATYTPDKTAIKKAIESGELVDGAELVINQNLQIK